jgi:4-alpha-glucanotransferase
VNQKVSSRDACRKLIEGVYMSQAVWVILPMQDILGLGEEARMNVPGTIYANWQWRLDKNIVTDEIRLWLRSLTYNAKRSKT